MFRFALFIALLLPAFIAGAQASVENADCVAEPAGVRVSCGYVTLPIDYDDPAGKQMELYYTIIHSPDPDPDPLVYLVGGPGSSGTHLLLSSYEKYLRAFQPQRDIVVIDQRGTGMSEPSLYCREALYRQDDILESGHEQHAELLLELLTDCHDRLEGRDTAFETYHSANNARDVTNALLAMGYERWNLVGVSYGSRLALAMMRDYPDYLRSVILDSVYPPQADIYIDVYRSGARAMDALFDACADSPACRSRYPNLRETFLRLYDQLNDMPLLAAYKPPKMRELLIEISGFRLYDWVFSWLYDMDAIRLIPKMIFELSRGKTSNAAPMGALFEQTNAAISLGMHYSVQCQEEYGSNPQRDFNSLAEGNPRLREFLKYPVEGPATLARLCEMWGKQPRPASANLPVRSDVPTLLLSGRFDPITPPEYAAAASETLSRAYSYVLPNVGHAALRSDDCAIVIALGFINAPLQTPDSSCIARSRPLRFR